MLKNVSVITISMIDITRNPCMLQVVCEELGWLPFYPGNSGTFKHAVHKKKVESPPNPEAIPLALDVCFYWITSFIKYSKWLENPSHVKAARFLSSGYESFSTLRFIF